MGSSLNKLLRGYYAKRGVELMFKPLNNHIQEHGFPYSFVKPGASFSPWITDEAFNSLLEEVKEHTLITEVYRFYELWQLAHQVGPLEGDFVEVGVWRGGSGALIATALNEYDHPCQTFLCDTFEGVALAGKEDSTYKGGEHDDTSPEVVQELFEKMGLSNYHVVQGIFPVDTADQVKTSKVKFCHIDVDVYQSAKETTEWVWDKLVIGGIIVYDDYGFRGVEGVTKYVESLRNDADKIIIHNLNGHAIIIKIA